MIDLGHGRHMKWIAAGTLGLAASVALGVAADGDVVKARIASYRELGAAFKNLNDELRKPGPQIYIVQLSARQIRSIAQAQYRFFPAGSGPRPGVKTAARAEIWTQPAQFRTAQDAFGRQAQAFATAAQSGDVPRIKLAAKALGQSCAACHKAFRIETN